ncbi:hypothetical protein GCM10009430_42970 [Aquimarina litoralis]|uniref:Knr4/Smi1-like domain-containing protein n=1 Tax=Aquimarina litoralis TaxID=584605 RepID=A0ABP3UI73_9FLAO
MINFKNTKKQLLPEELSEFEKEQGFILPIDYKSHILIYNGGRPDKDYFGDTRLSYFYPIKYGDSGTLEETLNVISDVLPDGFFPFAYDGGGNQICIALDEKNYGKIFIWYHDMDDDEDIELLANSFKEFMNGLTEE